MTPETLHRLFDVVADAPGGVQRLRELILQLAVRGKLVPQDPNDEPASVLLERIEEEKRRLYNEGKIRKLKKLPPVGPDEVPFEAPEGWVWVRLESLFYPISPGRNKLKTSEYEERGILPVIDQGQAFVAAYTNQESKRISVPGPVVVFGDHTRAMKYVDFDFVAGADGIKILCPVEVWPRFFYVALLSLPVEDRGYGRHYRSLINNLVALPPIEEQRRIVAKVDQLMSLCDELEERQRRRAEKRVSLNRSALHHLTTATDGAELYGHWRRIRDHFDVLYEVPETVAELRQAILQLAIRGKLVPQDPNDEPAEWLVKSCADKLGTTTRSASAHVLESSPHPIPVTWQWVTLAQIADLRIGRTPNTKVPSYWEGGDIPWVSIGDMPTSGVVKGTQRSITAKAVEEVFRGQPPAPAGTLLMSFKLSIGKVAFLDHPAYFNEAIVSIQPPITEVARYLFFCLRAIDLEASTNAAIKGQTLNRAALESLLIPLPPLAEQHRIVAKVDRLMALCDELEERLSKSRALAESVAAAVVHELTAA